MDVAAFTELVSALQNVEIAKYMAVATFMLYVYDYFLTIDEEVVLVWPSRWGIPKLLFFLNRYVVIADQITIIYVLLLGSEAKPCVRIFQASGGLVTFGFVTSQFILMMRTWAIWARKWWITVLLGILLIGGIAVDAYILPHYLGGVSALTIDRTLIPYHGCLIQFSNRIVYVDFILVIGLESIMLVLLIIKAFEHFQHSRSVLMVRMFKDGVIYFIFIMISSVANLVAILIAPIELHNFLIILQRVLHSIFCTRVLLHIRGAYVNSSTADTSAMTGDGTNGSAINTSTTYEFQVRRQQRASALSGYSGRNTSVAGASNMSSMIRGGVVEGVMEDGRGAGWGMGYGFAGKRDSFTSSVIGRGRGRALSGGRPLESIPRSGETTREVGEGVATPMSSRFLLTTEEHEDEMKRESTGMARRSGTETDSVTSPGDETEVKIESGARRAGVYRDSHATFGSSGTLPLPHLLLTPSSL